MANSPLLDSITGPGDVARIAKEKLPELAAEIRHVLLQTVSRNGGHLASNLGTVELTIALLRTFDLQDDRIIWDTGHQAYTYKLLTGRQQLMDRLRQAEGCCGFLHRQESPYDVFGAGHAGTAISAALGFAAARDRGIGKGRVVAVVGDGALGCGVSLEGLNSICEATDDFVLVLNDNKMSIAPNVGALAHYLNRIISSERYVRFRKATASAVHHLPVIGPFLHRLVHAAMGATKGLLVPGGWFEELGLKYIGPLDGHNIDELLETLTAVARLKQPTVIHVLTEKGRGYGHAEKSPESYHGLSQFDIETGAPVRVSDASRNDSADPTFSGALGSHLLEIMQNDASVVAITAGMCHGTGLHEIRAKFADRFFDVGIAEEHAVVFAAGLAAAGMKPVVAIYATFMQRAMDYVFHDVCLQKLPVVFCLDRAGIVDDGPTHHGIHDLGFWRCVPDLAVLQPADAQEQHDMLELLLSRRIPGIIRYPKGCADRLTAPRRQPLEWNKAEVLRDGPKVAIWGVGREAQTALNVADILAEQGTEATVVNPRFVMPFDKSLLLQQAVSMPLVVLENHCVEGGFGSAAAEAAGAVPGARLLKIGWPAEVVGWGTEDGLRRRYAMTPAAAAEKIRLFLESLKHAERGVPV